MQAYQSLPCEYYDQLEICCMRSQKLKLSLRSDVTVTGYARDLKTIKDQGEWLAIENFMLSGKQSAFTHGLTRGEGFMQDLENPQIVWLRIDYIHQLLDLSASKRKPHMIPWM